MPYEWSEIASAWLGPGATTCLSPEQLVATFNACEEILGREWIEHVKAQFHGGTGFGPTLSVAGVGAQLISLRNAKGFDRLVERLRAGSKAAFSELTAAYLCVRGRTRQR
jgi:hypothetical protein